jgi:hypothetical protein
MPIDAFSGRPIEHPQWDALFLEAAGGDRDVARLAESLAGVGSMRSNLSTAINACNSHLEHRKRVEGAALEQMEAQLVSMLKTATALKVAAAAVEKVTKQVVSRVKAK